MRLRYVFTIFMVICLISIGIGIYNKNSYDDFNGKEDALNMFALAAIPDNILELQVDYINKNIRNSNIIVAVECLETFTYRYSSTTQKVKIKKVFKGSEIKAGDEINVARAATLISTSKDAEIDGKKRLNMGFVNEMVPGKIYLVFLDRKIETYNDKDIIYVQSNEFILAPIFCYEEVENTTCVYDEKGCLDYNKIKDSEFFVLSEESKEKVLNLKKILLQDYKLE